MKRSASALTVVAPVIVVVDVTLVLYALYLGVSFEPTASAAAAAARGKTIGYPAGLAAMLTVTALLLRKPRWAPVLLVVGAALTLIAVAIAVLGFRSGA